MKVLHEHHLVGKCDFGEEAVVAFGQERLPVLRLRPLNVDHDDLVSWRLVTRDEHELGAVVEQVNKAAETVRYKLFEVKGPVKEVQVGLRLQVNYGHIVLVLCAF